MNAKALLAELAREERKEIYRARLQQKAARLAAKQDGAKVGQAAKEAKEAVKKVDMSAAVSPHADKIAHALTALWLVFAFAVPFTGDHAATGGVKPLR